MNIVTALISAGIGSLVTVVGNLIFRLIDIHHETKEHEYLERQQFIKEKTKCYIVALRRLTSIYRFLSVTSEQYARSEKIQAEFKKENHLINEQSSELRLYASDKIYNKYIELTQMSRYAFASQNGPRLGSDAQWAFNTQITELSRLMQADLGIRKYDADPDMITCPVCGRIHDFTAKCECGLTYAQMTQRLSKTVQVMTESENQPCQK